MNQIKFIHRLPFDDPQYKRTLYTVHIISLSETRIANSRTQIITRLGIMYFVFPNRSDRVQDQCLIDLTSYHITQRRKYT